VSTPTPVSGEPALILAVLSSGLALVVTFNIGLTSEQAGLWTALIAAVFATVTALFVRPVSPALFSGLVAAVFALLAGYHFHVSPATIGEINGLLTSLLMLVTRGHVSPVALVRRSRV
jgi:ABC-type thiamin/hydroxymethylpyrimidine transport system permease subunit